MSDNEIQVITEKIKCFMQGTKWGSLTIFFREGHVQKYEEVKTELPEERKRVDK